MESNQTLIKLLERREKEIRDGMAKLRAELKQLKAAKEAALTVADQDVVPRSLRSPRSGKGGEPTIKEFVVNVLHKAGKPLDALEILAWINASCDKNYARESLSPQLSRLGKDGIITRDGKLWSLTDLGRRLISENRMRMVPLKENPAEAGPSNSSEVTASDEPTEEDVDALFE